VHFPYERARETLESMARKGNPDAHLGHLMRYEDPVDGGWAMPTIAPALRLLPAGFATRPYRSSDGMVIVGVEGRGRIEIEGAAYDVAPHDVVVVPGWMKYTMQAVGDWTAFSFSDRAAQERLGFFREQRL